MRETDTKGTVAIWIASAFPVMVLAIAMPIEAGQWEIAKTRLQSVADNAAIVGMDSYQITSPLNATLARATASKIVAVNEPAATTATAMVSGIFDPTQQAMRVTVTQPVPLLFLGSLGGHSGFTISATATAELLKASGGTPPWQHCDLSHLPAHCVPQVTR